MPHGEREIQPQLAWLRVVGLSVSRRTVAVVVGLALALGLAVASSLLLFPRAERAQWVLDLALRFLGSVPPTDAIIAQLPPERLDSVRVRGLAHISRMLTPVLLSFLLLTAAGAIAYAYAAHRLRAQLSLVTVRRVTSVKWPAPSQARWIFGGIALAALLVHLPYALQSIRYDEDGASVYATSSWFAWANNLSGYQNHVAASLTIRLSTAMFGLSELSVRAPAILASSLALALLCTYFWSRFSPAMALTTAALLMALPLWAEQTALARGYGLSFSAAALLVLGLLRVHDESYEPSSASMSCLFVGVFLGCLAHGFFAFLVLGLFAFTASKRLPSATLWPIALWWLVLAGFVPAVSMAVGLPGTIAITQSTGDTAFSDVVARFVEELTFRHANPVGYVLMALWLIALVGSALALPARVRTPYLVLLGAAVLVPMLGNPVYVYPRYFLHTLALTVPCVAWFVSMRVLRGKRRANAACLAALLGVWFSTQPWNRLPLVDLRAGAQVAREQARMYGNRFAIDPFLVSGMRFYNGAAGKIVNVKHPYSSELERLLFPVPHNVQTIPEGFAIERRIPGSEGDILLLAKLNAAR